MSGWKSWAIGEVVEATDFQGYVQDQVVQVYADTAARGSALGTAVAEGMVSYLLDSSVLQYYDGSAWANVSQIGDITAVTAGTALSGGGTSGDVTLNVNLAAITIPPSQVTGVTASAAELNILDGATLTTAELNYVDGVTSAIQTQLNAKAALAGATFTGIVDMGTQKLKGGTVWQSVSAAQTIDSTDDALTVRLTGSTGYTFTCNSGITSGHRIDFIQDGTGQITFAAGSGVTLKSKGGKLKTAGQYSAVSLIAYSTTEYYLVGDLG
jgi:hypothetical protein